MMDRDDDEFDDLVRDPDAVADDGAARDAVEADAELGRLPRFLRLALMRGTAPLHLVADCRDLAPALTEAAAAWAGHPARAGWRDLAAAFDQAAARDEVPSLRGLADATRFLSMALRDVYAEARDASRVLAALEAGLREASDRKLAGGQVLARIERMAIGWARVIAAEREQYVSDTFSAHRHAESLGKQMTSLALEDWEEQAERRRVRESERAASAASKPNEASAGVAADEDSLVVCPPIDTKGNTKLRDAVRGHEHAVGVALPLVLTPDLVAVRRRLVAEFPYATVVIDRLLAPIVGRRHVSFPPALIVGPPGAGKSRLASRIAETLGVGIWRTDAARADGSTFGGTDRRWFSSEPCHAFLACSRNKQANSIVLVDEIDKASTRSDYGRIWDAMLGVLEPETARHYPDPCLQVDLDLSRVGFVATANDIANLPGPLLDRFRIVRMPEPTADDLDALVPPLVAALLAEQDLEPRWAEPLSAAERGVVAGHWRGGSVRRLKAALAVVMRARDAARPVQ